MKGTKYRQNQGNNFHIGEDTHTPQNTDLQTAKKFSMTNRRDALSNYSFAKQNKFASKFCEPKFWLSLP